MPCGDLGQPRLQRARLAGEHQRRKAAQRLLDAGQRGRVGIVRHLPDRLAAPRIRGPFRGHGPGLSRRIDRYLPAPAGRRNDPRIMPKRPIDRLRAICLALPEAVEKEAWGDPTFRVRDRIFAMEKRGDGRVSLWCKAPPGSQLVLVGADPATFLRSALRRPEGLGGHAPRSAAGLERGRDPGPAQLPADRAAGSRRRSSDGEPGGACSNSARSPPPLDRWRCCWSRSRSRR